MLGFKAIKRGGLGLDVKPKHSDSPKNNTDKLKALRQEIDSLDNQILQWINKRAQVVQRVGHLKNQNAVEYYIPSREKAIYDRLIQQNEGPLQAEAVRSIFREIISSCRALEAALSIAYLGPEGSYHHAAAQKHFGRAARFHPAETLADIFHEVERQRVDFGVAAIENSTEGSVNMTLDRLAHTDLQVIAELYVPISHNLISHSELHEIKKVYSHPQAIAQCRHWLESNLPNVEIVDTHSTTLGVKICSEETTSAAIASSLSSEIFDVPIQVREIEDQAGNTTRFYVVGRKPNSPTGDDKTALVVFLRNQVGALYNMLEPFREFGINLTNIVSRPTKQEHWQYMFFLECEGHFQDNALKNAIEKIETHSLHVKILGSFPKDHPSDDSES